MHALDRVTRVTADFTYNRWAIELAKTVHMKIVHAPPSGGRKRIYWKMSIDLSYPLVTSMGLHDPLDGLVTYTQLQATAAGDPGQSKWDLRAEIADMIGMCKGKNLGHGRSPRPRGHSLRCLQGGTADGEGLFHTNGSAWYLDGRLSGRA